jgi:hypothetical protein
MYVFFFCCLPPLWCWFSKEDVSLFQKSISYQWISLRGHQGRLSFQVIPVTRAEEAVVQLASLRSSAPPPHQLSPGDFHSLVINIGQAKLQNPINEIQTTTTGGRRIGGRRRCSPALGYRSRALRSNALPSWITTTAGSATDVWRLI